jgi:hypothetical protein
MKRDVVRLPRGRLLLPALVGVLAVAVHAAPAHAGPGMIVGADEDTPVWGDALQTASTGRALGLRAVRITRRWRPGESKVPSDFQDTIYRIVGDFSGLRIVVTLYGRAEDTPRTEEARRQYCSYLADMVKVNPQITDVVIWNDPNDQVFWAPQYNADGSSAAPADYAALLGTCWDALHAAHLNANVIATAVSRASAIPGGFTVGHHPPAEWISKLAAAYRASGRTKPIFDTFGYIPKALGSAERPWAKHPNTSAFGIGDYDALVAALNSGFQGSGQPLPGQDGTSIWYLAQGYQTAPSSDKAGRYTGTENDPTPMPARSPSEGSDDRTGPGVDQPLQLADAIRIAYCQPFVGAFFNFHLVDEQDLAGWQSGVYWTDGSPKPAYQALRRTAGQVNSRTVDCAAFSPGGAPPLAEPVHEVGPPLQITVLRASSLTTYGATITWQSSRPPVSTRVSYGVVDFGVPTAWAPVGLTGGNPTATLIGLDASTTYRIWVRAVSDDGKRVQATIDLTTPGVIANPKVDVGRPNGSILLNGQPWFPMMLYSVCPWEYPAALGAGINLFALNPCGNLQSQLNELRGSAYSAGAAGGHGGSGAGIVGWFHYDEPDGANVSADSLPPGPAGIGGLSFLTLTNHFYSGAAALDWGRGMYPSLIAKADVIGFDLYPLQEWCRPNRMADVYWSQRELVELSGDKPTFQWIEAADWRCPGGATAVTPAVVKAESWMAIAGGAHGLGFWPAHWPVGPARAIAAVARDVARLGPVTYMPNQPATSDNGAIVLVGRNWAGSLYVIAINTTFSPQNATMKSALLNGRTLNVLGESRRIRSVGDAFGDSFPPMGVHIYYAGPAE